MSEINHDTVSATCPVCHGPTHDGSASYIYSRPNSPESFRVHSLPAGHSCVDKLVDAARAGTLSLVGGNDSKIAMFGLALSAIEKHPASAERILSLAEKALS